MIRRRFPNPARTYQRESPDPIMWAKVSLYYHRLRLRLLPRLRLFTHYRVFFAAHGALGHDVIGRYCQHSHAYPVLWVDLRGCRQVAQDLGRSFRYVVRTTILHELAHAIQEWFGLPFDEEQAEEFAAHFYFRGAITQFWLGISPLNKSPQLQAYIKSFT